MGFLQLYDGAQRLGIEHVHHMKTMTDLHGRGIGVAVDANDFDAQALQFNRNFFAQFAAAEQHGAHGALAKGSA